MARLTLARKIASITLILWKKGVGFDAQQIRVQAACVSRYRVRSSSGIILRCSSGSGDARVRGRVSSEMVVCVCFVHPVSCLDPMPPRITQESYRPRVSDRTIANSATHLRLRVARNSNGAVTTRKMVHQGRTDYRGPAATAAGHTSGQNQDLSNRDKGLDVARSSAVFWWREKNVS
jgi:hypothetical protein